MQKLGRTERQKNWAVTIAGKPDYLAAAFRGDRVMAFSRLGAVPVRH
jgi:hypothetical protein